MDDKFLPIKFIEKRISDEQLPEPRGCKTTPQWVLKGDKLIEHAQTLYDNMERVQDIYDARKEEKHELPMVIATTIIEEAIAKTHRVEIVDLLTSDNQSDVIGVEAVKAPVRNDTQGKPAKKKQERVESRRILSIVASDELLANIDRALQNAQSTPKVISSITKIEPYRAEAATAYNPNNSAYRVLLIDYQNPERNRLAQKLFKNKCEEYGITIERETRYSSDMIMYRITLDSADDMSSVLEFEGVSTIEETTPILASTDSFEDLNLPAIKQPKSGEAYPTVGVLDSGIMPNQYLAPWIMKEGTAYYEEIYQDKHHGSMVSSIMEYSDELNGTSFFATEGVMMMEAIVVPDEKKVPLYAEDLIDDIRDAVERYCKVKVWNLSAGGVAECDEQSFSRFGMALDNIADENDVLFIKSAGNSKAFLRGAPMERVAIMADSVRSLVVGSIAGERGRFDKADIDMPSPFSRCGPGPEFIIKPDLVAYGGNAGIDQHNHMTQTGVRVLDETGKPTRAIGTSFSTPWVSRIASELAFLLDGDFDAILIKALMVHSARYPIGHLMSMRDKKKYMGFGMPSGTRDILYNSEHEITLVLRDSLEKGSYINIMDFPYPKSLIGNDNKFHGQIALTVVCKSRLKASHGPEYCQSEIAVEFGTIEGIEDRDTTKKGIRNPRGPVDGKNVLLNSRYKKSVFGIETADLITDMSFARERTLLEFDQKYYPVKKYVVDLDEMKPAERRDCLDGNRLWFLKVTGLFRDDAIREAKKTGEILQQEFCVLLTIRDPKGKAPVYTEVTQQLQEKNFAYSNVRLKNEIREHVRVEEDQDG